MIGFDEQIDNVVKSYHEDKRNKVYATEALLVASVLEEIDVEISSSQLKGVIEKFINGTMNDTEQMVYDAATYCCSLLARMCFGKDPEDQDEEVDYEISWNIDYEENLSAEIRPM